MAFVSKGKCQTSNTGRWSVGAARAVGVGGLPELRMQVQPREVQSRSHTALFEILAQPQLSPLTWSKLLNSLWVAVCKLGIIISGPSI